MKKVYILRGIPGSGKSELAQELAKDTGRIHSTNDYFYENGTYRFDPALLNRNRDRSFMAFCSSLRDRVETVVLENPNVQIPEYERYVTAAGWYDYTVEIIFLPHPPAETAAERSENKVPVETIRAMLSRWETDPREVVHAHTA